MEEIDYIVHHHGVKDAFMGLILVPLVEKAAEHLTGEFSSLSLATIRCTDYSGI